MKSLFVTSEMVPFAKTGGLADVCGSLPSAIAELGHEVKVVVPFYKMVREQKFRMKKCIDDLTIVIDGTQYSVSVFSCAYTNDVEVLFVDVPALFDRDELYGTPEGDYPDNALRFSLFQRSCLESVKRIGFQPDIIHCHDWQAGLIPVYLKRLYRHDSFFADTKTVFTIHNLAYHGLFDAAVLPVTGLNWNEMSMDKLEFYGRLSFIKGGLVYSDALTTVSKTYSREIQTRQYGCGLDGVLRQRSEHLKGILNGLDVDYWDPTNDPDITIHFKPNEWNKKVANKGVLQKENNLDVDPNIPLIGMITRLTDQKGLDILAPIMKKIARMNVQFVLLGTGEQEYNDFFADLGNAYRSKFAMHITFDETLAKRIYAGSDIFLMPSHFEPCGLGQMIALRYGVVPIVRATGGLADTVTDYDQKTGDGNGFTFSDYTGEALADTIRRAVKLFKSKKHWHQIVQNGMQADYSWTRSAKEYIELYKSLG